MKKKYHSDNEQKRNNKGLFNSMVFGGIISMLMSGIVTYVGEKYGTDCIPSAMVCVFAGGIAMAYYFNQKYF